MIKEYKANDDLMINKAIILGNVYETTDCNRDTLKPIENIKIQFETGDYVISDKDGQEFIRMVYSCMDKYHNSFSKPTPRQYKK